jgi:putative nucleotidyltransferase with HDIG domain
VLERAFDITTNLRLLELSNINQPALKELAVRAPGTYHHSIVVGNLSESAAEGVGVTPLLVRVASYYHDLGKMLCPLYFVENQGQRNYHDDLPARTSARIIINHVRDGLEIARRYKLGSAIADIIAQHHGNSLVRYFFHKAQEELGAGNEGAEDAEFRYPGPKPQSKEAGLVMVADVTEAAIRSLDDPSAEEIRQMVQKLATRIYMEGQLDESGLTFNDLNYIEKAFTRMLLSIHHHRIAYPDFQVPSQLLAEAAPQAVPDPERRPNRPVALASSNEPTDPDLPARGRTARHRVAGS